MVSPKIDKTFWAIKNANTGGLVGNKENRTLWKQKPTNAIDTIKWKYKTYYNKDLNLVPVKVRVVEVDEVEMK